MPKLQVWQPRFINKVMKLRKGDKIRVLVGKDKGREGKIEKVYIKQGRVLVSGINIYKKHIKKSDKVPQGGLVELPRPIKVSKVVLICGKCGRATRVGYIREKNKMFRKCKKCQKRI